MALTTRARSRMTTPVIVVLLILLLPPLLGLDHRTQDSLTLALVFAVAAVGLDLLSGYTGQFSIGNFAFAAVGAYTTAILGEQLGWGAWLTLPFAIMFPMALAVLLGVPMVRLGQLGSAYMTFFFGYLVAIVLGASWLSEWTHGAGGIVVPMAEVAGQPAGFGTSAYYLAWVFLSVVALLTARLADSRTGQSLRVIKRSPVVAATLGIDVTRARVTAFAYSAGAAGAAGFLYAQILGFLQPTSFELKLSMTLLIMVIVGGLGSVAGPILGAVGLTLLEQVTRETGSSRELYYAVILLVVLIMAPGGLFGVLEALWTRRPFRGRLSSRARTADRGHDAAVTKPQPTQRGLRDPRDVLLRLDKVEVAFGGVRALKGTQLIVQEGEIHALMGPNGAGKTTILNCISGLQSFDGHIEFAGESVRGLTPQRIRRLGITRTFQNPSLVGDLTVLENVQLGRYGRRRASFVRDLLPLPSTLRADADAKRAAGHALSRVGLEESRWNDLASSVSLGDQKLIDIARAMVSEPRLLLLDEPTAGLHDNDIHAVGRVLQELNESGLTILVIAHHVGFLRGIAHRATAVNFGQAIAAGSPDRVVDDPRVIDVFLGVAHA